MGSSEKLIKVLIYAYKDANFSSLSELQPNPISLPINPESFSQNYRLTTSKSQHAHSMVSEPKELKLTFILDGTNTIAGYTYNSNKHEVKDQLSLFMKTVYDEKNGVKQPRFLKIIWGDTLQFSGILSGLHLNYNLFKPDGDPLRIKITTQFSSIVSKIKNVEILKTDWNWEDLVLNKTTSKALEDVLDWQTHSAELFAAWEMSNKLKPSYLVLFHGPPGTGKTVTATLLGKKTNKNVYRIRFESLISKYIGETEKNLIELMGYAEKTNSILFFDEADALFGKRTGVADAHDSYANMEVSHVLSVLENFNGIIIFAVKGAIQDPEINRRFQLQVPFFMPNASERYQLWQNTIPKNIKFDPKMDLKSLSEKYELSGTEILNTVQFAGLKMMKDKEKWINSTTLVQGILREFEKRK